MPRKTHPYARHQEDMADGAPFGQGMDPVRPAASGAPKEEPGESGKDETRSAGTTQPEPDFCPRCAESDKTRLLALAELDNARKRMAREKEEFAKYAAEGVIADILPALDNLDLALAYAPDGKECANFVVGVDMTRKLLLDALSRHGLEQVGRPGDPFDPSLHEAVGMEPHADYASGQICGLLGKGYKLKDRLLRPAKVMVCKNG